MTKHTIALIKGDLDKIYVLVNPTDKQIQGFSSIPAAQASFASAYQRARETSLNGAAAATLIWLQFSPRLLEVDSDLSQLRKWLGEPPYSLYELNSSAGRYMGVPVLPEFDRIYEGAVPVNLSASLP